MAGGAGWREGQGKGREIFEEAVAVKLIQVHRSSPKRHPSLSTALQDTLLECNSPFLVKLHGTAQDDKHLYMMMEAVMGGELFSYLQVNAVRSQLPPTPRYWSTHGRPAHSPWTIWAHLTHIDIGRPLTPSLAALAHSLLAGPLSPLGREPCTLLRRVGHPGPRVPARAGQRVPRPEAGEPADRPAGICQGTLLYWWSVYC